MFGFFHRKSKVRDLSWMMVDMHSHLLPGIDDGLKSAVDSVSAIRALTDLGLQRFICSPHVFDEVYPNTPQTIRGALDALQTELDRQRVAVPVSASAEYMLGEEFRDKMVRGELLPLPGNYLLVEMPYTTEPLQVEDLLFDIGVHGYRPILAHPERYTFYYNSPERYVRLKDVGCLFQLNILAPSGYYGEKCQQMALRLLREGMYDIVGTDLHHERHLAALTKYVRNGKAGDTLAGYPFQNSSLFC